MSTFTPARDGFTVRASSDNYGQYKVLEVAKRHDDGEYSEKVEKEDEQIRTLLSAAPDLLDAAEKLLENLIDADQHIRGTGQEYADVKALRLAIKKARGA